MKTLLCLLTFCLAFGPSLKAEDSIKLGEFDSVMAHHFESTSPDGQWKIVKVGFSLQLLDHTGQSVLILDLNIEDAKYLEVKWSADSRRVAIAKDTRHDSTILAAWRDGSAWRKAQQALNYPYLRTLRQQNGWELTE